MYSMPPPLAPAKAQDPQFPTSHQLQCHSCRPIRGRHESQARAPSTPGPKPYRAQTRRSTSRGRDREADCNHTTEPREFVVRDPSVVKSNRYRSIQQRRKKSDPAKKKKNRSRDAINNRSKSRNPTNKPNHDRAKREGGGRITGLGSSSTPRDWEAAARRERSSNISSGSAAGEPDRNETSGGLGREGFRKPTCYSAPRLVAGKNRTGGEEVF